jgi:hypothetical protein
MTTPNMALAGLPALGATRGGAVADPADAGKLALVASSGSLLAGLLPRLQTSRSGALYYIDCEGGDDATGNGSESAPYRTCAAAVAAASGATALVLVLAPPSDNSKTFAAFTLGATHAKVAIVGAHPSLARVSGAVTVPSMPVCELELRSVAVLSVHSAGGATALSVRLLDGASAASLTSAAGAGLRTYTKDYLSLVGSAPMYTDVPMAVTTAIGHVATGPGDWDPPPPATAGAAIDILARRAASAEVALVSLSSKSDSAVSRLTAAESRLDTLGADVLAVSARIPQDYSDLISGMDDLSDKVDDLDANLKRLETQTEGLATQLTAVLSLLGQVADMQATLLKHSARLAALEAGTVTLDRDYRAYKVVITDRVADLEASKADMVGQIGVAQAAASAAQTTASDALSRITGDVNPRLEALETFKAAVNNTSIPALNDRIDALALQVNPGVTGRVSLLEARAASLESNMSDAWKYTRDGGSIGGVPTESLNARVARNRSDIETLESAVDDIIETRLEAAVNDVLDDRLADAVNDILDVRLAVLTAINVWADKVFNYVEDVTFTENVGLFIKRRSMNVHASKAANDVTIAFNNGPEVAPVGLFSVSDCN